MGAMKELLIEFEEAQLNPQLITSWTVTVNKDNLYTYLEDFVVNYGYSSEEQLEQLEQLRKEHAFDRAMALIDEN